MVALVFVIVFVHMSQSLTTTRKRVFEDDVPVLCGIGSYVVHAVCEDAFANVGAVGMVGVESAKQVVCRFSL